MGGARTRTETGTLERIVRTDDGVSLASREWPGAADRPALLVLHGLASTSHIFDLVAPLLAPEFRVVAYDQRGHGRSGKPAGRYGFERTARDAWAVIQALRLRHPVILGHSWGGSVALEVAVRHAHAVAGAILLDGGFITMRRRMDWPTARAMLSPPPLAGLHADQLLSLLRRRMDGVIEVTPQLERIFLSLMRVAPDGTIRPRLARRNHMRILRAMWEQDPVELLGRVHVPVLVLATRPEHPQGSEEEFLAAKREAARHVRAIGGDVRFEWIRGIHDVPLQRPAAVARRVEAFARDLGLRG